MAIFRGTLVFLLLACTEGAVPGGRAARDDGAMTVIVNEDTYVESMNATVVSETEAEVATDPPPASDPSSDAEQLLKEEDPSPVVEGGAVAGAPGETVQLKGGSSSKRTERAAGGRRKKDDGIVQMEYPSNDLPQEEDIQSSRPKKKHRGGDEGSLEMRDLPHPRRRIEEDEVPIEQHVEDGSRFGFVIVVVAWLVLIYYIKTKPTSRRISEYIQWFENWVVGTTTAGSSSVKKIASFI
mmetsp:Transcript_29142/g.51205  ORF Transcript_29142/g.51205 Transcript_29142/m.51205 type:complete len:239 (-) Transcript_29142:91-807(-)|eukprot:CAMPEP_0197526818 /NCGR_PEP_ID=MMETSP1318-20131121/19502_1 /TAXON_ID=552666 /ORGANISM="Partenskyella glossopodia, Strain RCC365" /LENGTH=238 /DNA_ID=CAMNT_0043081173 /DNA_START=36 /DNA_END=752 /DNA_ORIENTATION=+